MTTPQTPTTPALTSTPPTLTPAQVMAAVAAMAPAKVPLLEALPTELIDYIIRFAVVGATPREIRRLRLVCRLFNTFASQHGVRSVIAYFHRSDFNAIQLLASQPHIAMGVRSFTYVPDMVRKAGPLEVFRHEYHDFRKIDIEEAPTQAARRKLLQTPALTNSQIHTHWLRTKAHCAMQSSLIEDEDDIEFLQCVLPLLPNLEELTMQSEAETASGAADPFSGHRRRKTPFDDGLTDFLYEPMRPEGLRAMNIMMEAVPAVNRITTLRAGALNWRFFEPDNRLPLERCFDLARNLTHIGFQIETGADEENERIGVEALECRDSMRHGVLREVLRRATNLESLYVDFDMDEEVGYPAHLHDVISPSQHWPRLRCIEIGGFECERGDLENVLRHHQASLKQVFLRCINLQRTSWALFLEEMNGICPSLDDGSITGPIRGEDETTQEAEFWDVADGSRMGDEMANTISGYLSCKDLHYHPNPFLTFPYFHTGDEPLPE